MKYSVTTVSLPELTMVEQAELLGSLGYDGVELRVRRTGDDLRRQAKPSNWGYHVNDVTPENFRDKAPEIKRVLSEHGLGLAGIASNAPCTDIEQLKGVLEGAVVAGAGFIRVGAADGFKADGSINYWRVFGETVAGYARVLEMTRGTGVKIILEMHGNTIHPSASLAYRVVSQFDPAEVGVIYDPQNMVRDGYETIALAMQLLGPYVAHCHVGAHRPVGGDADENGTVKWTWEACRLAEGLFDFTTMMRELKALQYAGYLTVEDFRSVPAEDKLRDAIAYLKRLEAVV